MLWQRGEKGNLGERERNKKSVRARVPFAFLGRPVCLTKLRVAEPRGRIAEDAVFKPWNLLSCHDRPLTLPAHEFVLTSQVFPRGVDSAAIFVAAGGVAIRQIHYCVFPLSPFLRSFGSPLSTS